MACLTETLMSHVAAEDLTRRPVCTNTPVSHTALTDLLRWLFNTDRAGLSSLLSSFRLQTPYGARGGCVLVPLLSSNDDDDDEEKGWLAPRPDTVRWT